MRIKYYPKPYNQINLNAVIVPIFFFEYIALFGVVTSQKDIFMHKYV